MIDENKAIRQANQGAAAEKELREVASAFVEVKGELFTAWMATAPRDETGREKLWIATTILTQVEKVLQRRVNNGNVAKKDLEAIRKAGEPKTILGIPV